MKGYKPWDVSLCVQMVVAIVFLSNYGTSMVSNIGLILRAILKQKVIRMSKIAGYMGWEVSRRTRLYVIRSISTSAIIEVDGYGKAVIIPAW